MLDIKLLRENPEFVKSRIATRGVEIDLDLFKEIEQERRACIREVEQLERARNDGSKDFARLKKGGGKEEIERLQAELRSVSEKIKALNESRAITEERLRDFMLQIPNIPHDSVPIGKSEEDNEVIAVRGEPREFDFKPLDHVDLGKNLGVLDLERAAKITGARFALYIGMGARLERALINFMLDLHVTHHGYTEVLPPFIANKESLIGTGNLPKFEDDLFHLDGYDYYLIPTAEVPVTNIHRDEMLTEEELPVKYAAYTPCFRKEAGSYGRDVRGIVRQHQFNKVELVKLARPEESYGELESLTENASRVLDALELPYRIVSLCTGDIGFSSAKTYDIEVWIPSEGNYREISSCSNYEEFQARRANIRYRPKDGGKPRFVHTLNGSGVAAGRAVVAILENYQERDGSVKVPRALVPYMGGVQVITAG